MPWYDVMTSGCKNPRRKTGLNYETFEDSDLRNARRPLQISPEVKICSIRASGKMRVFGCYMENQFFVLWFDRNHLIVPD
ncbi:MAG: hypothetical protein ACHQ9S_14670 [Candidatus Binatia bacterium]